MPAPSIILSMDTETDRIDIDDIETTYCCLCQICALNAKSPEDVKIYESEDADRDMLLDLEKWDRNIEMHVYNLAYEFEWLRGSLISLKYKNIPYNRRKKLPSHCWRALYDKSGIFKMDIVFKTGKILTIKDDLKLFDPSLSMEKVAEGVRAEHPDWFCDEVKSKEKVEYNTGWHFHNSEDREKFIEYAKIDAFSQSRITKYIIEKGLNSKLSSTSTTFHEVLKLKYPDIQDEWKRLRKFKKDYPPLDLERQLYAEERLIGGFVYGEVGTFSGHFTKWDYKSSYPYEYVFGALPRGKIRMMKPDDPLIDRVKNDKNFIRWVRVSFDFSLKQGMLPCISGKECSTKSYSRLKMKEGHCDDWLYTEDLWNEICEHYNVTNVIIHEYWYARKEIGGFAVGIEHFFSMKENAPKGTAQNSFGKKGLNAGAHGKNISKTRREKRVFAEDGEDLDQLWVINQNEPELCFMIGFTALENARARLLKDCRRMIEHGYHVYVTDTDSMVTDAPKEAVAEILPERMMPSDKDDKEMTHILGKFALEEEFDGLKCWGLKRYLQTDGGEYVKSAFAGMHDDAQKEVLKDWKTDGTVYSWRQKGKQQLTSRHGVTIVDCVKHAGAMDIWYRPEMEEMDKSMRRIMKNEEVYGVQYNLDQWKDAYWSLIADTQSTEDMVAYLTDIRYDEIDPFWKKHIKRAYEKAIKENETWQ